MTKNLYSELGVDKSASGAELKNAYRKKSMKAHPDHGGDPEKFKALVKAYKILENPETRKRYDSGEDPDKMASGATQMDEITLCVISLYADVIDQVDPDHTDVINTMNQSLLQNEKILAHEILKAQKRIARYESAIKRTHSKAVQNFLAEVMRNKVGEVHREIAEFERQRDIRVKAREMLANYSYRADKFPSAGFTIGIDLGSQFP